MPEYSFQSSDGQTKDIFYFMKDVPSVGAEIIDEHGVKWKRVFTSPRASIDTQIDPESSKDFRDKLANKNYNLGQLWDTSKELSEKREAKNGKDSVRESYFNKYKKEHRGQEHPHQKKEKFVGIQLIQRK